MIDFFYKELDNFIFFFKKFYKKEIYFFYKLKIITLKDDKNFFQGS